LTVGNCPAAPGTSTLLHTFDTAACNSARANSDAVRSTAISIACRLRIIEQGSIPASPAIRAISRRCARVSPVRAASAFHAASRGDAASRACFRNNQNTAASTASVARNAPATTYVASIAATEAFFPVTNSTG
jgi:hypothetical protein